MRSLIGALTDAARRAGTAPVPYVSRTDFGAKRLSIFGTPSSRTAHLQATSSNGTLYGVVEALTERTSAVSWQLWKEAKSGLDEDRTAIPRHPLLDLWKQPNPFMNNRQFVTTIQQYYELTGEGPMIVVKVAGLPLELWPVRPDRLEPVPDPDKFLAGWIYHGPGGEDVPLDVADVLRIMRPDPDNIYRGLGPVQALMRTLDSARYGEEWNRQFFLNSAEPGGVIESEERLSDEEFKEFQSRWAEAHKGISNAHRVAILENGMKWVDRKFTMKDMQFTELNRLGDDKILTAFRMPKFGVGQIDDVNRATAEAARAQISADLIVPRLDVWYDLINIDLAAMYGPSMVGTVFDYDDPVPPDAEQDNANQLNGAQVASLLVPVGFDGDSIVEAYGLPKTLKWTKPADPAPPANEPQPEQDGQDASDHDDAWHSIRAYLVNEDPQRPNLSTVQQQWAAQRDQLVSQYREVHADQVAELQAQIDQAVREHQPASLATLSVTYGPAAELIATFLLAMASLAAAGMVAEAATQGITVLAGVADEGELRTVADVTAALLAQGLAASAGREALRRYTVKSDAAELAQAVADFVANVPAGTDAQLGAALTRAQNAGRMATLASAPAARYYAIETLDKNTCPPCKKIDGKELPTLDAAMLAYGGGPYLFCEGTVRCRGTFVAVWDTPDDATAILQRMLSGGKSGPKAFDPAQPRDPHTGKWISVLTFTELMDEFGDVYDHLDDDELGLNVSVFESGTIAIIRKPDPNSYHVLLTDLHDTHLRRMADDLRWAASEDIGQDEENLANGLVGWKEQPDFDSVIGFDLSGDVSLRVPRQGLDDYPNPMNTDDYWVWDFGVPEAESLADELDRLADSYSDMPDPSDQVDPTQYRLPHAALDDLAERAQSAPKRPAPGMHAAEGWTKLGGGQSAMTFVSGTGEDRVVFKRAPEWGDPDAPKTQADAEQLASLVGQTVGADVVSVYRDQVDSVFMEWIDGVVQADLSDGALGPIHTDWLAGKDGIRVGLLDALSLNGDRNDGNLIFDDQGNATAIDHGSAFAMFNYKGQEYIESYGYVTSDLPVGHFIRTDLRSGRNRWVDNPLTTNDIATLRERLESLRDDFDRLDRSDWFDSMTAVVDQLAAHATGTEDLL